LELLGWALVWGLEPFKPLEQNKLFNASNKIVIVLNCFKKGFLLRKLMWLATIMRS
jgi:hypothetical protein